MKHGLEIPQNAPARALAIAPRLARWGHETDLVRSRRGQATRCPRQPKSGFQHNAPAQALGLPRALARRLLLVALGGGALVGVGPLAAAPLTLHFDPGATTVRFTLGATLHTVEGTARLRDGVVELDPERSTAGGRLVVEARSLATGSAGRDEDMHAKVLESSRFPTIELVPERFEGTLPADGGEGPVTVVGRLLLHGGEQPLRFPVTVRRAADRWRLSGRFTVPYVAWGLRDPSKFLLRVDPHVEVTIDATVRVAVPAAPADPGGPSR
jgi:polyisoprenoid-binding protein YceI